MSRIHITILFLVLYVIAIIAVGIWNSKNDSSEDYFLASRKLPAWLLAITFIASRKLPAWLLAITFIASWWGGGSAIDLVDHVHKNGMSSFWIYGVPVLIATTLMFLFAKGIRNIGSIS